MWPIRDKNSSFGSVIVASTVPSCCSPISGSEFFEDLVQLFVQRGGGERLDHVTVGAGLRGGDDVFLLRFAVTISTGSLARAGSARMFCNIVRPSMFGIFQSETTKSKDSARSLASAITPSSASSTLA